MFINLRTIGATPHILETVRHLCKRVREHGHLSGSSNIAEHKKHCKSSVEINNFKVLCSNFKNYWERVSCEALIIKAVNPAINVQSSDSSTLLKVFT